MIDYLKDYHQIEIQLDRRPSIRRASAPTVQLTKSLKDVSLKAALRVMLHELGLTYVIRDGVLMITTPAEAEERRDRRRVLQRPGP